MITQRLLQRPLASPLRQQLTRGGHFTGIGIRKINIAGLGNSSIRHFSCCQKVLQEQRKGDGAPMGLPGKQPEINKIPSLLGKPPLLLAETVMATKEQRKADWAIMKEMAKYLWPKVGNFHY